MPLALEAVHEALRMWQSALPPGHEHISTVRKRVYDSEQAIRLGQGGARRTGGAQCEL
jgi:hypothetical protein